MQLTAQDFFRKPSQIISWDILKEASSAMYYWATDFKPDLTHGSVIKKWSSRTQFFFQNMIRWCQNLLLLNYSYAFERSFDCKVTSRFLPSVVSYPAKTFRTQIVETSRIQRIKSFRTHLNCFVPSSVVSSCKKLSSNN